MMNIFGSQIIFCPVSEVQDTIEQTMDSLRNKGFNPYFIQGGGHGNIGTEAYVKCYDEIRKYETKNDIAFDYIFFASGTGTMQAGLICGKLMRNRDTRIVGISIARKYPYGRDVIINSIKEYLGENVSAEELENNVIFDDSWVSGGYGESNEEIIKL